ncbi:MAG: MerR family transcriptional regulator [Chlamydiales bacterium]
MAYTVKKLAKLSGVSVRTLHWYDEVGLLKPAYYGSNGYRYYEEEQLLALQQILFFKELGFELKQIQNILVRDDFSKIVALSSHRQVLLKNKIRIQKLIKTIDKTIEHLKGNKKMNEKEIYDGFDKEKQKEYERQLIERFGDSIKKHFRECEENTKNWDKSDWEASHIKFDVICKELTRLLEVHASPKSKEVQDQVGKHFEWISQFWTPTKESYTAHGQLIIDSELSEAYKKYHEGMPEFVAEGIRAFSENKLS